MKSRFFFLVFYCIRRWRPIHRISPFTHNIKRHQIQKKRHLLFVNPLIFIFTIVKKKKIPGKAESFYFSDRRNWRILENYLHSLMAKGKDPNFRNLELSWDFAQLQKKRWEVEFVPRLDNVPFLYLCSAELFLCCVIFIILWIRICTNSFFTNWYRINNTYNGARNNFIQINYVNRCVIEKFIKNNNSYFF